MTGLVLSLFPGIGLLDMAFEEEGFCVVRGPDLLWGGDVHRFHPPPQRFAGVIGGPPCKRWSRLAHMVVANGYELAPDLIPEFERIVWEARPLWFLMENVPAAPAPDVLSPTGGREYRTRSVLLNNRWCGGEQHRERRFTFGAHTMTSFAPVERFHVAGEALEPTTWAHAVPCDSRAVPVKRVKGGGMKGTAGAPRRSFAEACRLQGLPEGFDLPPFTASAKFEAVGNGVPLPMGRAVARAVKAALVINQEAA
jgi:DNA (cytosine-5)-methyltransferase 1